MFGGARAPRIRNNYSAQEIASLRDMDPQKAEKKLQTINDGGSLCQEYPTFPQERSCNDCVWIVFFVVTLLATSGVAGAMGRHITETASAPAALLPPAFAAPAVPVAPTMAPVAPGLLQAAPVARLLQLVPVGTSAQSQFDAQALAQPTAAPPVRFDAKNVKPKYLVIGTMGGTVVAILTALCLVFLSKHCGTCVVYTSLLFSCIMIVVMGFAMITMGGAYAGLPAAWSPVFYAIGGLFIILGFAMAGALLCCWGKFIAFTAQVVTQCGEISLDNCGMFFVAMVGAIFSAAWSIVVVIALDGVVAEYQSEIEGNRNTGYAVFCSFFFVWIWGCMVSAGVCYTSFCGVFGRWYFSDENPDEYESGVVASSFCSAATTSLGSICFGTFLVAAIRTAAYLAEQMERDAFKDGNPVICIVMCCIRCVLQCIGDIIEYFNEWAYVQCALRNTTFCESAKIVYSLCTIGNVYAIWATLLIDSVVNFGSFMAGFAAALVGAGVGYIGSVETALLGALCGLVAGNAVGWCCMSVFTAGSKTLLTCWAESPETLLGKSAETMLGQTLKEKEQMGGLM